MFECRMYKGDGDAVFVNVHHMAPQEIHQKAMELATDYNVVRGVVIYTFLNLDDAYRVVRRYLETVMENN